MSLNNHVIKLLVLADDKQFKKGMKGVEGATQSLGVKLGTLAKGAAVMIAGKALGAIKDFAADSVRAFSDLEQATGGTEAVFGDLADRIERVGKTAAATMGLSETEFRTATTSMGGQLKRMTGDVELAADKSIFLTQVAADLAATYGGTTTQAVQALGAAFRGEADPAERFNLNLKIGEQNAKAVEMGLAKTTSEVDDHARALALVELITEQSADAQGRFARELDTVAGKEAVFNAKLENTKALLGQSLAPAKNLFTGLKTFGLGILTDMAQAFGTLTGQMSMAESKMIDYQQAIEDGKDANEAFAEQISRMLPGAGFWTHTIEAANDGLKGAQQVVDEVNSRLKEYIGLQVEAGMSVDDMRTALEQWHRLGQITDEQYQFLTDSLAEWREETRQQERDLAILNSVTERYTNRAKDAGDATYDLAAATEYSRQQLVEFREEQRRGLDVSSDFITALDRQKEAQEAYTEAVKEHGPASEEAQEAALNMAEANGAVIDSALAVADKYPDVFEGMFQELLDSGVAPATARAIVDQAQAQFNANPIHVRLAVQPVKWTQQGQSAIPVKDGPRQFFHEGGVVPGTGEVTAVLKGGETVLPTHKPGFALKSKGPSGNNYTIQIQMLMGDPDAVARAVVEALQRYERLNGPIPIGVRTL